jgi:hypothetical protein
MRKKKHKTDIFPSLVNRISTKMKLQDKHYRFAFVFVVVVVAVVVVGRRGWWGVIVVVVVVVYPFVPLEIYGIFKHLHLTLVARQPLNFASCFAAFFWFLQNGLFPGLLRSSFHSGSLRIPVRYLLFN